jgi:hypothetical protein
VSLTFVVSTGRSGSTMLSRILHMHPAILSLSEFVNSITGLSSSGDQNRWEFPTEDMDGQELWQLISAPSPLKDAIVLAGLKSSEMCYPYDIGRFDPATGVPTICNATLPLLTDDPDAIFDQLAARLPSWPKRSAAEQFRALFSTLADMFGRTVIVERSGSSLPMVSVLRRLFPEARFVLQYRDGLDCALSMSRHVSGQFAGIAEEAIRITGLPTTATWEELLAAAPEEFNGLLTEPFDVARIMAYPVPMTFFGQGWAWMMWVGIEAIKRLPRDIWTTLQYERLIASPVEELTRLADFINVPATPEWLDKACSSMDSGRVGSARNQLDPDTLAALREACEPGTQAIRQLESEYGLLPKLPKLPVSPTGARRGSSAATVASRATGASPSTFVCGNAANEPLASVVQGFEVWLLIVRVLAVRIAAASCQGSVGILVNQLIQGRPDSRFSGLSSATVLTCTRIRYSPGVVNPRARRKADACLVYRERRSALRFLASSAVEGNSCLAFRYSSAPVRSSVGVRE